MHQSRAAAIGGLHLVTFSHSAVSVEFSCVLRPGKVFGNYCYASRRVAADCAPYLGLHKCALALCQADDVAVEVETTIKGVVECADIHLWFHSHCGVLAEPLSSIQLLILDKPNIVRCGPRNAEQYSPRESYMLFIEA